MNRLGTIAGASDPSAIAQADFELLDAVLWDQSTIASAASIELDFADEKTKDIALAHNLALTAVGMAAGRQMLVRIVDGGAGQTIAPEAGWIFVGSAAPSAIAAGKTAILLLKCFGATAADVVAWWWVQP